jgi:endonuclease/exonuclease/phosphatase family metal-dependent hydrolase
MCGVRHWNCQDTGGAADKRRALERLASGSRATRVLLLQEACEKDVEMVRERLGPGWTSAFHPYAWRNASGSRSTVRCDDERQGAAGLAILSAHRLEDVRDVPSPQPAVGLIRGIVCARVTAYDVQVCVAHLTTPGGDVAHPAWEYRDDQLQALFAAQHGRRVVFGGDLNVPPPGPRNPDSWVWPAAAHRDHRECDQSPAAGPAGGRATHTSGHKVDHLFTGLPRTGCEVFDTGASDHRALLMTVRTDDG